MVVVVVLLLLVVEEGSLMARSSQEQRERRWRDRFWLAPGIFQVPTTGSSRRYDASGRADGRDAGC